MRQRKYRPSLHDFVDDASEDAAGYRPRELRDWDPNPEERLARKEVTRLLERAIRALPRKYREVFCSGTSNSFRARRHPRRWGSACRPPRLACCGRA